MAEKYYKVAESALKAIADAIRVQKKVTAEQRLYTLNEMPRVIRNFYTLPADFAEVEVKVQQTDIQVKAKGILPTVHKGSASVVVGVATVAVSASAMGALAE